MKPLIAGSPTAALEAELITHIKDKFNGELKAIEPLSGAWTDETVKKLIRVAPAAYIAFIGNSPSDLQNHTRQSWAIFLTVDILNGQRVDPTRAYLMHDYMIAILHQQPFNSAARAMQFTQSGNLYTELAGSRGLFVYGLYFSIDMPMPSVTDISMLDDFITYYQKFNGTPNFESLSQLEQPNNDDN